MIDTESQKGRRSSAGESLFSPRILIGLKTTGALVICLMAICLYSNAREGDSIPLDSLKVKSASEAYEIALRYTGFNEIKGFRLLKPADSLAELITSNETMTPFEDITLKGRYVWRVEFQDVTLDSDSASTKPASEQPKDFYILLDAETGLPLKIKGASPNFEEVREKYRTTEEEIKEQLTLLRHAFHGFPKEPPALSFLQVLNADEYYSLPVKEVTAVYIEHSSLMENEQRPRWVVYLHGLPPVGKEPPLCKDSFRYSDRIYTVDAFTGKTLPIAGYTNYERVINRDEK
jgi:hypothetical protein